MVEPKLTGPVGTKIIEDLDDDRLRDDIDTLSGSRIIYKIMPTSDKKNVLVQAIDIEGFEGLIFTEKAPKLKKRILPKPMAYISISSFLLGFSALLTILSVQDVINVHPVMAWIWVIGSIGLTICSFVHAVESLQNEKN